MIVFRIRKSGSEIAADRGENETVRLYDVEGFLEMLIARLLDIEIASEGGVCLNSGCSDGSSDLNSFAEGAAEGFNYYSDFHFNYLTFM